MKNADDAQHEHRGGAERPAVGRALRRLAEPACVGDVAAPAGPGTRPRACRSRAARRVDATLRVCQALEALQRPRLRVPRSARGGYGRCAGRSRRGSSTSMASLPPSSGAASRNRSSPRAARSTIAVVSAWRSRGRRARPPRRPGRGRAAVPASARTDHRGTPGPCRSAASSSRPTRGGQAATQRRHDQAGRRIHLARSCERLGPLGAWRSHRCRHAREQRRVEVAGAQVRAASSSFEDPPGDPRWSGRRRGSRGRHTAGPGRGSGSHRGPGG